MPIRISRPNGSLRLETAKMNVTDGSEIAGSTVHTVGVWFNPSSDFVATGPFTGLVRFGRALEFSASNANFRFYLASLTGGVGNGAISFAAPANEWTFAVYRTQSGLQELFINGSGVGSATATYTSLSTSTVLNTIRGPAHPDPSVLEGSISFNGWFQVNKRLTDQEILDLYNGVIKPQDFSEFNFVVPMNLSSPSQVLLTDEDLVNIGNASYQFTQIANSGNYERIAGNQHNWASSDVPVLRFTYENGSPINNPIETIDTIISPTPLERSIRLYSDDAPFDTANVSSGGTTGRLSIIDTVDASGNNFTFGSDVIPADSYIKFNFEIERSTITSGYESAGIIIETSGSNDVSGYYLISVEDDNDGPNLVARYGSTTLTSGEVKVVPDLFINSSNTQNISVTNEGEANLIFGTTGWLFSGQISPIDDALPLSLSPSGSANASFSFNTSLERSVTGYLQFSSNDADSPFTQTFVSRVLSPTIVVSDFNNNDVYEFGNVQFNSVQSASFEVLNIGSTGLLISASTQGNLSLGSLTPLIQPGTTGFVNVSLLTNTLGDVSGILTINSNDPKAPSINIIGEANISRGNSYYNRFGNSITGEPVEISLSTEKKKSSVASPENIFIATEPSDSLNDKIDDLLLKERDFKLSNGEYNLREVIRTEYEIIDGSGDRSIDGSPNYFYRSQTEINQKEI